MPATGCAIWRSANPSSIADDPDFRVVLTPDKAAMTLTIADNGIGMNHDELVENLGTIARSGTAAFVQQLSGDQRKDMTLIGQFGVGFYSAFMVAANVEVLTRKAGETQAWRWVSDGKGEFTVEPAEKDGRGTTIRLSLLKDDAEYTDPERLRRIVTTYSDHIALPIVLAADGKEQTLNTRGGAVDPAQGRDHARAVPRILSSRAHAFDEPWLTLHNKAEGTYQYTTLLFVPGSKPFDLFDPQRKARVKLYVRRVFITDDCAELLPPYLRFLRGIVDSEDLPLNVSREMLQNNPMLTKMRGQITKRVLSELGKKAKDANEEYAKFWENFGAVLKEGLYEDPEHREQLLPLLRFRSTAGDGLASLDDYVARMKPGQEAIYTITGDNLELLRKSPQLEGFRARGVEVLLLTDPIDEFWMPALGVYQQHPLKSVTRGGADLDKIKPVEDNKDTPAETPKDSAVASLIALFKLSLGDAVKDVRVSDRLTDSAVCLVADEGDLDMHLERLLKRIARSSRRRSAFSSSIRGIRWSHGSPRWSARTAPPTRSAILPGCCSIRPASSKASNCPIPNAFARRLSTVLEKGLTSAA